MSDNLRVFIIPVILGGIISIVYNYIKYYYGFKKKIKWLDKILNLK